MTGHKTQISDMRNPDFGYNDDTFTCAATASDADGDSFSITYEWTDSSIRSETSSSFDASTVTMFWSDL